jgi:uncharacterized protein (TIGR02145 family)
MGVNLIYAQCTNSTVFLPSSLVDGEANSGGNICVSLGSTVVMKGVCWLSGAGEPKPGKTGTSATQNGSGGGSFTTSITGLIPGSTISVRSYAFIKTTISLKTLTDTVYGNLIQYPVPYVKPNITSFFVYTSGVGTAVATGRLKQKGQSAVTKLGVCWSTSPNPTLNLSTKREILAPLPGFNLNKYSFTMNNLLLNTIYYVRVYAVNAQGISYGEQMVYKINGTVRDADGKFYGTVKIGSQEWTRENLKTNKRTTGERISGLHNTYVQNGIVPPDLDSNIHGFYYNGYDVKDARGVCPTGWHVPTDADWKILETTLGMVNGETNNVGGQLKEISVLWDAPNFGATNGSGFSAVPAGSIIPVNGAGRGIGFGYDAWFWTSSERTFYPPASPSRLYIRRLSTSDLQGKMIITGDCSVSEYHSLRCVKD